MPVETGGESRWAAGRLALVVLAVALLLCGYLLPDRAAAQPSFSYGAFYSQFDVNRDGTLRVRHRVTYRFQDPSGWVGIYVPRSYGEITEARVLDATGEPLPEDGWEYQAEEDGSFLWYYSSEAGEEATVVYEYSVTGALRVEGDRVTLEWNGVPANRGCPVEESSVTVTLPEPVEPSSITVEVRTENHRGRVDKRVVGDSKIIIETDRLAENSSYSFRCRWPSSIMDLGGAGFRPSEPQAGPEEETAEVAKSWSFQDFDVDLTVNPDASITVRETHLVNFVGDFTFFNRDLSGESGLYEEGRTYGKVRIKDIAVYELDGLPYPPQGWRVESIPGGKRVHLELQASNEVKGWVIEYRMTGCIVFAPEYERIYWNAVPAERSVPVSSSTLRVYLPPGTDPESTRTSLYLDNLSPPASSQSGREGDVLWWKVEGLPPYTTYTVDLALPRGTVSIPWQYDRPFGTAAVAVSAFLVLATLGTMLALWWKRGRDMGRRGPQVVRYQPPEDMPPAVAGMLVHERPRLEDIAATIVDLARRGYLTIFEKTKRTSIRRKEYGFQRLEKDDAGLLPYESEILQALFEKGDRVTEDDLENAFYTHVDSILQKGIRRETLIRGLFAGDPRRIRTRYLAAGATIAAPPAVMLILFPRWLDLGWFQLILASSVFCGAIVAGLGWVMPRRTPSGSQALAHLRGFREYLVTAEREELAAMTPEYLERNLPYAMVLGVAEEWARRVEGVLSSPPSWFQGSDPVFTYSHFAASLQNMSDNLGRTMTSQPGSRGSGGSGFGGGFGGGFSGGGFGGGGASAG